MLVVEHFKQLFQNADYDYWTWLPFAIIRTSFIAACALLAYSFVAWDFNWYTVRGLAIASLLFYVILRLIQNK